VNEPFFVRCRQAVRDLDVVVNGLAQWQRPAAQTLTQSDAFQQF
jgi:hypothetical protein